MSLNWTELQQAFLHGSWRERHYLDLETGDVCVLDFAQREQIELISDASAVPDALRLAYAVEMDDERYVPVPICQPRQLAAWRDLFSAECEPPFRRLLWSALDRSDAAHFERTLALEPAEQARWQRELAREVRSVLTLWLRTLPVEWQ